MKDYRKEKLNAILREYAGLPEYSEMPIPEVNTKSLFSDYPLNIAATRGIFEEVIVLLENGADINVQGEHGYTPLHNATEQGHLEIVKFLISHGARIEIGDSFTGATAKDLAEVLGETEIYQLLDKE